MKEYRLTDWLPTTKKEVELRGWDELDVILFSGDAYVDHPSFGAAVIGRILEAEGLRVAIIPQPNWRDDLRDFKKLGRPRLFFGISPGCMDSMVNKYTANKRLRSDDAYTPDARPDMRPEYPSIVYTQILKKLDRSFDLPYTRLPHPKYKGKRIPAYDMIKFSVNLHRGCFGGCAFCTISAHQGKFIVSRSKESILKEVKAITELPDFKGYLSDLGGPSANMYRMKGRDEAVCRKCKRPSCIYPKVCPNLNTDHRPLLDIYHAVDALPGIKKSFIGSGVRYDLLLHQSKDPNTNKSTQEYTRELIARHVSGRLKVAPEHTSDRVLNIMRKPPFSQFGEFKKIFDRINHEEGLRQQLIPYFISSHPGCKEEDMAELAVITKRLDFHLEQVQDFTPTPMTVATEAWYTGFHPYTLEPVFSAKTQREKLAQRQFFFWYKPEERRNIINELRRIGRTDLIDKLYGKR
ncbi:DUF3362 domain-containing protein [Bacteroides uniformis]|uniref:DUF3362 domain-containing protein n=2 Tax=Bacteroides uniformis TaxID=820 RepID=UPI00189B0D80|nr:DUF3362 domain-containing protein [Bacteroides uniformis]